MNRPVRTAFFVDYPHQQAGAAKSLLAAVVRARDDGTCDPMMITPSEGIVADACRASRLEVRVVPGSRAYETFGRALPRLPVAHQASVFLREVMPYAVSFARALARERVEVAHFNTARGMLLAGGGAHLARVPTVLHVRGTPRYERRYWVLAQALTHRFVLVARALERDLLPSARARARVVYDGVAQRPSVPRESARRELVRARVVDGDVFSRTLVLTSLSSFVPFKGLHHVVRALDLHTRAGGDAALLLAGTSTPGPYEAWLRRLVTALGLEDRVRFLGFMRDPHDLLCASDALVLPSVEREALDLDGTLVDVDGNEGLPHSVLEAMMVGLPCVASDIAGVTEEVSDGVSGIVVPPGEPEALRTAIARLEAEPETRVRMGARGQEVCRAHFSLESAARGLADALRSARDAPNVFRSALANAVQTAFEATRG